MKITILGRVPNKVESLAQIYSWFGKTVYQGLTLLGHEVQTIYYKTTPIDVIEAKLFKFKPEIIFTHLTFHKWHDKFMIMSIFENLREYFGTKVIHTLQDARLVPRYSGDISNAFDMALVGNTEAIPTLTKIWNIPVHFWPYSALTQSKFAEKDPKLEFDGLPVFTGSPGAHHDRSKFLKQLQTLTKIKIIRTKSPEDLKHKTAELSVSAYCILALCTGYNIMHYTDCRFWQYGGSGAFIIGRRFKGMDDLIPRELYVGFDSYDNPKHVANLINEWKNKDTSDIRYNMFKYMQRKHSSVVRMEQTLELIQGKRKMLDVFEGKIK